MTNFWYYVLTIVIFLCAIPLKKFFDAKHNTCPKCHRRNSMKGTGQKKTEHRFGLPETYDEEKCDNCGHIRLVDYSD